MSEPSIIPVERYVQELWDRDATDLLLTAGGATADADRRRPHPGARRRAADA